MEADRRSADKRRRGYQREGQRPRVMVAAGREVLREQRIWTNAAALRPRGMVGEEPSSLRC